MSYHKVTAQLRDSIGKGEARRLRQAGKLPGVIYGKSIESQKISLSQKDVDYLISHNHRIVELNLSDDTTKVALVKEVQVDPIKNMPIHIDFQVVEENEHFKIHVPVRLENKIKSHGVRMGGQLVQHIYKLNVRSDLKHLPAEIVIDIIDLTNSQSSLVRDIKIEGVQILAPDSVAICSISKARAK